MFGALIHPALQPLSQEAAPWPGLALCWVPLSQTPSPLLPKSCGTHRESRATCPGRTLTVSLSGCGNWGVCLSFLVWKKWVTIVSLWDLWWIGQRLEQPLPHVNVSLTTISPLGRWVHQGPGTSSNSLGDLVLLPPGELGPPGLRKEPCPLPPASLMLWRGGLWGPHLLLG